MKEGELKARHQAVLDVIQARFPEILPYAKKLFSIFSLLAMKQSRIEKSVKAKGE